MQRIGALDNNVVDELRRRFDGLDERFNRFEAVNEVNNQTKGAKLDERFASLEPTLTSFIASIQQQHLRSTQAESSGGNQIHQAPSNTNQVLPPINIHNRGLVTVRLRVAMRAWTIRAFVEPPATTVDLNRRLRTTFFFPLHQQRVPCPLPSRVYYRRRNKQEKDTEEERSVSADVDSAQ
ncbi:hypothetical protein F2Q69_00002854 [Brassica cretica]|uniref:Uncharacterized protein n=1 Tax=Brassica cretica TaxID=69181 RepID=A0A8S9NPG4_BRACR|nr:hypothetical protein F2Q69_00002854 [Brassica cretica]